MKKGITTIVALFVLFYSNAQVKTNKIIAPADTKLIFANDYLHITLEKLLKADTFTVVNTQPKFLEINFFKTAKIPTYIDIDTQRQFLFFNTTNALKEGTTDLQALQLISDINGLTKLIKASFNKDKNTIELGYYYWIDGGFTKKSFLSSLNLYKSAYIYAIGLDKLEIFK